MTADKIIDVFDFLHVNNHQSYALVLLNSDVCLKKSLTFINEFSSLWNNASLKASVDGATNLIDELNLMHSNNNKNSSCFVPDLISGDFDSINKELLVKYKDLGSAIYETADQNHIDFTKCLRIIGSKYCPTNKFDKVVALSYSVSDRFDQVMANVNALFEAKTLLPSHVVTCLLSPKSCTYIVEEGSTKLVIDKKFCTSECSIFPLSKKCKVTTVGLVLNYHDSTLEIGQTSNFSRKILETTDVITVITDGSLLFSIQRLEKYMDKVIL